MRRSMLIGLALCVATPLLAADMQTKPQAPAQSTMAAPSAAQKAAMYERILDDLVTRKLLAAGSCSRPSYPVCCKVGGYAACERSVAECNRLGGTPVASAPGCY